MERLSSLSSQITSLENFVKIEYKTAYNVLLICKPNQPQSYEILEKIFQSSKAQNLAIKVYVEKGFSQEDQQLFQERYSSDCNFFESESCEQEIDIVVTYGGDGTILYTVNKFQKRTTPPILAISGGTLGFMCIYSLQEVEIQLNNLFQRLKQKIPIPIERKMRLQLAKFSPENEITEVKHAINEFVIERGALSNSQIQLNINQSLNNQCQVLAQDCRYLLKIYHLQLYKPMGLLQIHLLDQLLIPLVLEDLQFITTLNACQLFLFALYLCHLDRYSYTQAKVQKSKCTQRAEMKQEQQEMVNSQFNCQKMKKQLQQVRISMFFQQMIKRMNLTFNNIQQNQKKCSDGVLNLNLTLRAEWPINLRKNRSSPKINFQKSNQIIKIIKNKYLINSTKFFFLNCKYNQLTNQQSNQVTYLYKLMHIFCII